MTNSIKKLYGIYQKYSDAMDSKTASRVKKTIDEIELRRRANESNDDFILALAEVMAAVNEKEANVIKQLAESVLSSDYVEKVEIINSVKDLVITGEITIQNMSEFVEKVRAMKITMPEEAMINNEQKNYVPISLIS